MRELLNIKLQKKKELTTKDLKYDLIFKSIDLIEDIYFTIVKKFKLPIQAFDRNRINLSIQELCKIARFKNLHMAGDELVFKMLRPDLTNHTIEDASHSNALEFTELVLRMKSVFRLIYTIYKKENFSEAQYYIFYNELQINIEYYLKSTSSVEVGTCHVDSIRLRFSNDSMQHKRYIRAKKRNLLFKIAEESFHNKGEKFNSTY